MNRYFPEENVQRANETKNRCSWSSATREMQIKTTVISNYIPARITKKRMTMQNSDEDAEKLDHTLLMGI